MNGFTFLSPEFFYIIPFYFACKLLCTYKSGGLRFSRLDLVKKVTKKSRALILVFEFVSLLAIVLALADPAIKKSIEFEGKPKKCMFVVDMESSAKESVETILNSPCDELGVVTYGSEVFALLPLSSMSKEYAKELLEHYKAPIAHEKHSLFEALLKAKSMLLGDGELYFLTPFITKDYQKDIEKIEHLLRSHIITDTTESIPSAASEKKELIRHYYSYPAMFALLALSIYLYLLNRIET